MRKIHEDQAPTIDESELAVFPEGLEESDWTLIIEQCRNQDALTKKEIEGFAQAYLEAKELALDEERLKSLTPEELEKLIFRWAVLMDKENATGFRGVPAEMPGVQFVLDNKKIPSAMKRYYDLFANDQFHTAEQAYKEIQEIHPLKDGNGRLGDLLWKIAVIRETGKWPEELPPDLFPLPPKPPE